jgi:hypothetical protein
MSVLPPERDAILIIDPDAVSARLVSFQQLETVAGGNRQIVEPRRGIEQFQLPLNDAPDPARKSPSRSRISLAEQVGRRVVAK